MSSQLHEKQHDAKLVAEVDGLPPQRTSAPQPHYAVRWAILALCAMTTLLIRLIYQKSSFPALASQDLPSRYRLMPIASTSAGDINFEHGDDDEICGPCGDQCLPELKPLNVPLGESSTVQILHGNESAPFWPGHSMRLRFMEHALPVVLEWDCSARSPIQDVCQNMCHGIQCRDQPMQLTRNSNVADCRAARSLDACGSTNPPHHPCSAYPFTSTIQAQTLARGASSTRCVPTAQHLEHGWQLMQAYAIMERADPPLLEYEVGFDFGSEGSGIGYCHVQPECGAIDSQK